MYANAAITCEKMSHLENMRVRLLPNERKITVRKESTDKIECLQAEQQEIWIKCLE